MPPLRAINLLQSTEGARLHGPELDRWRRWGPYLSERQWGTVREDYSEYGTAWDYFPHDHARSRAYRWGEDGIAGFGNDPLDPMESARRNMRPNLRKRFYESATVSDEAPFALLLDGRGGGRLQALRPALRVRDLRLRPRDPQSRRAAFRRSR